MIETLHFTKSVLVLPVFIHGFNNDTNLVNTHITQRLMSLTNIAVLYIRLYCIVSQKRVYVFVFSW